MAMIGYARVSTTDQKLDAQIHALRAAGCKVIFEEHASGGDRERRELATALKMVRAGDIFVVTKLDRVGRDLLHLIQTIDDLTARGVAFRSLGDSIDTSSASGRLILQVMGAVAEFERALIRDRTLTGLAEARRQGRVGGNPKLKAGDATAAAALGRRRRDAYARRVAAESVDWLPDVQILRPKLPWSRVVAHLNRLAGRKRWTEPSLIKAVRSLVDQGLAEAALLEKSKPPLRALSALKTIQAMQKSNPDITPTEVARHLTDTGVPTPRNRKRWYASTVKNVLSRAPAAP